MSFWHVPMQFAARTNRELSLWSYILSMAIFSGNDV